MEQVKVATTRVFDTIVAPLLPLLREQSTQLKEDANTYRLSLEPFVLSLVFAGLNKIKSISLLITETPSAGCTPYWSKIHSLSSGIILI